VTFKWQQLPCYGMLQSHVAAVSGHKFCNKKNIVRYNMMQLDNALIAG